MDVDRWKRIKDLVAAALDQPSERRDAWLVEACASTPHLVPEVRTLLDAAALTGGFLDGRGPGGSTPDQQGRVSPGQRIGHYELVEWIGAGGMGDVFRARDLALGRDAALKLLPRHVDEAFRRRLLDEAEASAKLQHPAIATFYEAGEAGGETFIAMEFVRGITLRERLRDGPLPPDQALSMTSCLLEALAHAHAAGLLHRDIKPENIILTDAHSAKLLDFSIALSIGMAEEHTQRPLATATSITERGGLAGTIGYLAPEQLTGDPLDARTDLFQVGAVLIEALTGTPAFGGASLLDRLAAVMTTEPDLASLAAAGAPPGLADVVRRALARHPAERYASAASFLRALHDLTDGGLRTAGAQVVAIVDFANHSGDDRLEWLGAALAESVRIHLARIPDLVLIPRDRWLLALESIDVPGSADVESAVSLGLGCRWVVDGQIERWDALLSIRARLVDVATGRVVTTGHAEGPISNLFALQDRVAQTIAAGLRGTAATTDRHGGDTALEAYECYTRARVLIDRFGKASLEDARALLERVIAIDARHVDALAALAMTYGLRAIASPTPALYEAAVTFADRALALDPEHVRAHVWKGYALAALGRLDEADTALDRALELDPADTDALYFAAGSALLWRDVPRAAEAVALLQRAVEVDANHGMWWLALGTAHRCLNGLSEARYCFTRARKLEGTPTRFATAGTAAYIAETLRPEGRLAEARAEALAGIESAERSDHAYRDTFRAHGLTVLGRVALDQQDFAAAEAAFHLVLAQARGRPRPRAFGHFVVQSLCGLARATREPGFFLEGRRLFDTRERYNFDRFYGALAHDTLSDLAGAAVVLDRRDEATLLEQRAQAHASSDRPS